MEKKIEKLCTSFKGPYGEMRTKWIVILFRILIQSKKKSTEMFLSLNGTWTDGRDVPYESREEGKWAISPSTDSQKYLFTRNHRKYFFSKQVLPPPKSTSLIPPNNKHVSSDMKDYRTLFRKTVTAGIYGRPHTTTTSTKQNCK